MIYRLGSLGDTVVALPCFHKIESCFPGAERIVLTNLPVSAKAAPLESVLGPGGLIDRAIQYPLGLRDPRRLIGLMAELKALEADTLVYLSIGRQPVATVWRNVAFLKLCGFRRIIGAPLTNALANPRLVDPATGEVEREAERLARCLAPLGPIDLKDPSQWDLRLTPAEHAAAAKFLSGISGDFIAVNTGGKEPKKDWGDPNWRALLGALVDRVRLPIVFVGDASDAQRAAALEQAWPWGALNACGVLSPRECGALLARARIFVGHDSGPLHLAAVSGTACVGLFGGFEPPRRWHPFGAHHRILHGRTSVLDVSVEDAASAVNDLLLPGRGPTLNAAPSQGPAL